MKFLSKKQREKLLKTEPKSDVPEMKECPLNIYVMAVANMCLKYMRKLGVSETVCIHLSTKDGQSGIITFSTTKELYAIKGGRWTKI